MGHVAAEHAVLVQNYMQDHNITCMKGRIHNDYLPYSPRAGGLEVQLILKFKYSTVAERQVIISTDQYYINCPPPAL